MTDPTISRTESPYETWRPHRYPDGFYRLAAPGIPYDLAKTEPYLVLTRSMTTAGKLVEVGFRLRMSDGLGGLPSMVQSASLSVIW